MNRPDWSREGPTWPNREASRFVGTRSTRWHVQIMGEGPDLLLLHGTGASTHSWAPIAPFLSRHYRLLMVDLPGHGFTRPLPGGTMQLERVVGALDELLAALECAPTCTIGHSAGAAIACRLRLETGKGGEVMALNGALAPLVRHAPSLPASLLRPFMVNPLLPRILSAHASDRTVGRQLDGTGSHIPRTQRELYRRLFRYSGHLEGTLAMMADWDLESVRRDLDRLSGPLHLLAGEGDRFIPASQSRRIAREVGGARFVSLSRLGHLAHEEAPEQVAEAILSSLPDRHRDIAGENSGGETAKARSAR